ncbi:MAG: hypothetical protein PVI92_16095, partial [Chromatiales bacterium]
IHLIVQGVKDKIWQLADPNDFKSPVIQRYLNENPHQLTQYSGIEEIRDQSIPENQEHTPSLVGGNLYLINPP